MTTPIAFEHLIQHEQFVRQTLRGLLRDESRVDDAVQETWLRALRRRDHAPSEPRPWLARIARNLAISHWRSDRRRERRELQVAPLADHGESAAQSQLRVEMRQRVVTAILALDEPYRTVVLLRYEQQLDVAAIASRLARTPATVRSQLSRAHDLLRTRLDADFGGRERWLGLAAPLAFGRTATARVVIAWLATGALIGVIGLATWRALADDPRPAALREVAAHAATPSAADRANGDRAADAVAADLGPERYAPAALPATQEPAVGAIELLDRSHFDDYEAATFSFVHGVRDDPDLALTRNDWDLQLAGGQFSVQMVVDDHSAILDLGPLAPADFATVDPTQLPAPSADTARVIAGHAYFVSTRDDDTDVASVVFVRSLQPRRSCTFDWFTTDGTARSQGSVRDPGTGRAWIDVLTALRARRIADRTLQQPRVVLQQHGGAGGGNPRRIHLSGDANGYVHEVAKAPLDLTKPATIYDSCMAYAVGGFVPAGRDFVVTRIDYSGGNHGDSNGDGHYRIVVDGKEVVAIEPSKEPIQGAWTGRVVLRAGSEARTFFECNNSSWGEVVFTGEFVAATSAPERGFGAENAGFGVPHPATIPVPTLAAPFVRLQLRSDGGSGGNECRLDMRGRHSVYVSELSRGPIDMTGPIERNQVVAFANGGKVPAGQKFVVTEVTWSGKVGAHGNAAITIAGEKIFRIDEPNDNLVDSWHGELTVLPGEESRTQITVVDAARLDVWLTGHFAPQ